MKPAVYAAVPECPPESARSNPPLAHAFLRDILRRMPLARAIGGGVFASVLGAVAAQCVSFLGMLIAGRILGRDVYGRFAIVQTTVAALAGLSSLGLGVTATKCASEYRGSDPARAGRTLGLSSLVAVAAAVLCGLILWIFAPVIASQVLAAPGLAPELRLASFYVFFTTLNGYQTGALAGFGAFARVARITALGSVPSLALTYFLTRSYGLDGAAVALGLQAFLLWALSQIALRLECRSHGVAVSYAGAWTERRSLGRLSLPSAVSGVLASSAIWYSGALLVRRPNGFREMALFSAANGLRLIALFLPNMFNRVIAPLMNSVLSNGDWRLYRQTFRLNVLLAGGSAALGALFMMGGRSHILGLFGKDFRDPGEAVFVLLAATMVEAVAGSLYQALFAHGRLWLHAMVISIWSVFLIAAASVATRYGARGLAGAYLVAWILSAALYTALARRLHARHPASPRRNAGLLVEPSRYANPIYFRRIF
jgi:O-antigen/teichoic acid export membrane protein